MDSLEKQFRDNVVKAVLEEAIRRIHRVCVNAAKAYMEEIDTARGFFDVTGNLYQSFAVGIYLNGLLIGIERVSGDEPLMTSLEKGEAFPFERYYSGDDVEGKPYIGEIGEGNQWGPAVAEYFLRNHQPENKIGFSLVVVAAMDYAEFVESKANHDVLSKLRDDAEMIFLRRI